MKLTPEIEAKGLRAYEQVCAFERLRAWRLPLSYVVFTLIPVVIGMVMLKRGFTTWADLNFLAGAVLLVGAWFHWRHLCVRYVKNQHLLAELEQAYGEQLPWVLVEKHFAELAKLKRELEEESNRAK